MKIVPSFFGLQLIGAVVTLCLYPVSVSSQSITPTNDGTGTQINPNGNRYDIEGGSLSQDGQNLFHSFEKFGLDDGEIANFLSNPDIRNILGRVVGGDASIIQGLIQVTGGNSNLFLMNPAGIVFGANASLNVPADFTATTATGIQFNQNWFNAVGNNDYQALIGTPSGYNFAVDQPGVILNEGNLTLSEGSNLTLLGGTVINTGELSSPGGQITIAAVEGENLVRISQDGQLLNLEISAIKTSSGNYPITPLSLPQLLTGGETTSEANTVVVSNGQVILKNSDTVIPEEPGTTIAAGRLDVSDDNTGGTVNIFSSSLSILESEINTSGENLSGNLLINSDNNITINQLLAQTSSLEITAEQEINVNQITTEGSLTATTNGGSINRIGENSLITAPTVLFQTGETGGIGTVENPLLLDVDNIEAVAGSGGIFLEANSALTVGNVSEEITGLSTTGGGEINLNVEGDLTILEDISTQVIDETNAGDITLNSGGDIESTEGSLDASSGEIVFDEFGDIESISGGEGDGGNISLTAEGNITTSFIYSSSEGMGRGGDITLNSNSGEINTTEGSLNASSYEGDGGNISLTAEENITTTSIDSNSESAGRGGDITLNSNSGEINTTEGSLDASSYEGDGGNISLTAEGNITTSDIDSNSSGKGRGGDITLNSNSGEINTTEGSLNASSGGWNEDEGSWIGGDGGNISLTAEGNITTESDSISNLEIRAGRNINLNANIDTSATNGNITLEANAGDANPEYRDSGTGNIIMQPDTILNAGRGDIRLVIGTFGETENITENIGDITIANLQTTGNVTVDARGGNILSAANNSLITADSGAFYTRSNGAIGSENNPLRLNINTLEGNTGGGGAFFNSPNQGITITQFLSLNGGDIVLTAQGNIITEGNIATNDVNSSSSSVNATGNITLESTNGAIDTTAGSLWSYSSDGNGGNVILTADGNITTGDIDSRASSGNAGEIKLESTNGEIDTTQGSLSLDSSDGNGGNVTLTADGNITTGDIDSSASSGNAGEIKLESTNGEIDTTQGRLFSYSSDGNGGNVILTADGNITTGDIDSSASSGNAGEIKLESTNGEIDTTAGSLWSYSSDGNAGNITLTAEGNIITGDLYSFSYGSGMRSGDISITSRQGTIDTTVGEFVSQPNVSADSSFEEFKNTFSRSLANIDTFSPEGIGGNVTLEAQGDITVYDISSLGGENSGNVEITTQQGNINTAVIFSTAQTGNGGSITLNSPQGTITTSHLLSYSEQGTAGNVSLDAAGHIEIQSIRSDGLQRGGNIDISSDSQNSINILGDLYTFSEEGTAGDITLASPGNITTQNIRSDGQTESGDLSINSQGEISTQSITTQADNGPSGNIIVNGNNVAAGNVESIGTESAGTIQITATDGSVTTADITSSSTEGNAGGSDVKATENINTGSQTVESAEGDASITNEAGNDIDVDNQTAEANNGDANIENTAENIETENQTATSDNGNASINNVADNNINTDNQTATTNEGDASIDNIADNNINTDNQAATSDNGNASINNTAGNDINTENQTATSDNGNASINNIAGNNINTENQTATSDNGNASINNVADNNINTDNQTATSDNGNASIDNIAGNDINTDNQTATNEGDASINNVADNNINTENQTATSDNGNASIDNVADNNINTDNQTATSDNGNASINNVADNNINTENQTATTNERDASINNTAGNDINTENQTATTNEGNALIRNEAGNDINVGDQTAMGTDSATIENIAGGTITTESQIALEDGNPGTIINQEGDANPSPPEIVESESIVNPVASQTPQVTPQNSEQPLTNQRPNNDNNTNNSSNLNNSEVVQDITLDPDGNYDASNPSSDVANALNLNSVSPLSIASADTVTTLELSRNQEFTRYFGEEFAEENLTTENVRNILNNITQQTGTHSAVVYITLQTNQLELVIFTAEGQPLFHRVEVTREEFVNVARQFYIHVANPRLSNQYIKPAQQLYDWLIRPLEPQLQQAGIDTILLSLDSGLRGLPIAALHDGEQFLIEKYSLSLIPSISLIDTNYRTLANTEVLAMGASEFTKLDPLPAVPLELELITQRRWQGESFLNQEFTRDNLINQRQKHPYSIIHLATHSDFSRKTPDESYIQLWQDEQLKLNQLRTLGWQNPPLELLILSSCRTAVGDEQAEMGFAGLAVQAGVKSALASLWYVNDVGTLALMSEFYRHLDQTAIKADALRKAQLAMIQGSVEDLETLLYASQSLDEITLTTPISSLSSLDLSHPYYWSGFTMIGSPW